MTEPLRFVLHVAPRSTKVQAATKKVALRTDPVSRVIVAAVPGAQGIQGPPGEGAPILGETPTGMINGVNMVFGTAQAFQPNTTGLYLNGLREFDYTETGSQSIMLADPPLSGDSLRIDYIIL